MTMADRILLVVAGAVTLAVAILCLVFGYSGVATPG